MVQRRFGPLIVLVVLGVLALCARLFQVQVLEHRVWSAEAMNLVRSGAIVPYQRGAIRAANGEVWVHDRSAWSVEFCYRDFRRANPIAQVVHAVSSVVSRSVGYEEALPNLARNARALALLSPSLLAEFARGRGLAGPGELRAPPSVDVELDQCAGRAADLRFYVQRLLGYSDAEALELRRAVASQREIASYVDFLAERRKSSRDELLAALDRKLERALDDLRELARLLASTGDERVAQAGTLEGLIAQIESWRARVEDESATELFRQAANFAPGRVEPATLAHALDFEWIEHVMRWDAARTADWLTRAREVWRKSISSWVLPSITAEMQLAPADARRVETTIGELAAVFADPSSVDAARRRVVERDEPLDWRSFDSLAVLCELDSLVDARASEDFAPARAALLPFADDGLRTATFAEPWEALARVELAPMGGAGSAADFSSTGANSAAWRENAEEHFRAEWIEPRLASLLDRWESALQREIAREFEVLLASAKDSAKGAGGRLRLEPGRIALAGEQIAYVLKDRGNRPFTVVEHPSYELIETISRYRDSLAGFDVRAREERVREADAASRRPLGGQLIGDVGSPSLFELRRQRRELREADSIRRQASRTQADLDRLAELFARVEHPSEKRGMDGIEGYFDTELSGHIGYRESRGLEDLAEREAGREDFDLAARNGDDLVLTLEPELQRAAEECVNHPDGDKDAARADAVWNANPVGALILCTPDGDVLAAASAPLDPRAKDSKNQRDWAVDRTLRILDHQPPGSVLKPCVVAYALDHLALDPRETQNCAPHNGEAANYKGLHCSHADGHGVVDLSTAIKFSCNCYFAWLGEQFDAPNAIACLKTFGFGQPTGVRAFGPRSGLREDSWPQVDRLTFRDLRQRLSFANGLSVVETTPMQVARAYAGLATGWLPRMRLVRSIGAREIEKSANELPISASSLEFVRNSLLRVTDEPGGTGYPALHHAALGFEFAAKTGSGDYRSLPKNASAEGDNRVRKHTWVAGWFPAKKPVAVLVVFEFDTIATSTHGAIWLAAQYLKRPEVRAYMDAHQAKD